MQSDRDLLILSRHVLCSDCAINHHDGHQTINIEKIKYSKKDIKMTTSKMILELFRQGMDDQSYTTKCRLRHGRIESIGRDLLTILSELDYKEEGECGYLGELIKMELINKYIEDIDQKRNELIEFSTGKTECECNRLYNRLTGKRTLVNYKKDYDEMCRSEIERFTPGCPLFFKSHLKHQLKFYEMIAEVPPKKVTPEPFNDRQCPLCVTIDHNDHKQKPIDYYRKNWLDIVENIWKNELPPLSDFCYRCLDHLNLHFVGSSCGKWEDSGEADRMFNSLRFLEGRMDRRYRKKHLRNTCEKPDCLMKDPKFWKYEIIREVRIILRVIIIERYRHRNVSCQLKDIRMGSTFLEVIRTLLIIDLRKHSREEFNLILKNMDNALERLKKHKSIIEQEIQAPTCRCSELWTMNERVLEKKRTRNDATQGTRELCLEFKKSMEEMAKFSLKEEIPGCPMDFDHGIVLNPIVLEKLEDIDLEDSFEIIDLNLEDSFEIIDVKFY
ncbi:hypothetical protein CAEBREN_17696 [Caenorhabditis brenneri]|uniref:Uncharacterized protein n=1 Tax=Caenorhabditis brenneri TaxID=135651 RepID=G0P2L9_CAEBE|nr:hypothetical protein CAEBREN_17696 [Caenorhabditis brenneri]